MEPASTTTRYEILLVGFSYLLTDSVHPARAFGSSAGAIAAAIVAAGEKGGPAEVYLWENDAPKLVYSKPRPEDVG
jgi:hypothetical protein